jgi:hypothetical protein
MPDAPAPEESNMPDEQKPRKQRPSRASRRFGYAVSIAVNAVMLFIVNNILSWDWSFLSWLTDEFADLLPYVNLSIVASIIVSLISMVYDPLWFRSLTQVILAGISLVVVVQTYRIFPFDFSETAVDWTTMARVLLVIMMVALVAGIIGEMAKLVRELSRSESLRPPAEPAT